MESNLISKVIANLRICIVDTFRSAATEIQSLRAQLEAENKRANEWAFSNKRAYEMERRASAAEQKLTQIEQATIERCAKVCEEMYLNPPNAYKEFDLFQGWKYALDLAEQQILALPPIEPASTQEAKRPSLGE